MLHEGGTRLVRDEAAGLMECFLGRRVTIRGASSAFSRPGPWIFLRMGGLSWSNRMGGEMMQITAADVSIGTCARERGEEDA